MYDPGRDHPHFGPRPGWASDSGAVALAPPSGVGAARGPEERAVEAVIATLCWALDERHERVLGECFAAGAVLERRVELTRDLPTVMGREQIAAALARNPRRKVGQLRHFLSGTVFERLADGEATVLSRLLVTSAGRGSGIAATGYQRARLAREGAVWRIVHLEVGYDVEWEGCEN